MFYKAAVFIAILALGLAAFATEGVAKRPAGPTQIKSCGTLSEPGSYVVVRNLTAVGDCLVITADFVNIDLGGFTLTGDGTGEGITSNFGDFDGTTVRNGTMTNFATGIFLNGGEGHMIEGVRVVGNIQGMSIDGDGSTITGNIADANSGTGIIAGQGSTVTGNTAKSNVASGIFTEKYSTVSGNTTSQNNTGLAVTCPSNVVHNTALGNNTNLLLNETVGVCNLVDNLAP